MANIVKKYNGCRGAKLKLGGGRIKPRDIGTISVIFAFLLSGLRNKHHFCWVLLSPPFRVLVYHTENSQKSLDSRDASLDTFKLHTSNALMNESPYFAQKHFKRRISVITLNLNLVFYVQ